MAAAIVLSIADQVRAAVAAQCDRAVDDVEDAHDLARDLDADTLDRLAIALALEERFGVAIDDAAVEGWVTVGDIAASLAPPATMEKRVA